MPTAENLLRCHHLGLLNLLASTKMHIFCWGFGPFSGLSSLKARYFIFVCILHHRIPECCKRQNPEFAAGCCRETRRKRQVLRRGRLEENGDLLGGFEMQGVVALPSNLDGIYLTLPLLSLTHKCPSLKRISAKWFLLIFIRRWAEGCFLWERQHRGEARGV